MKGSPKFFGKALVGAKGQIVIPAEARKALNINTGDSVMIISGPPHHEKMISLIPEDEFNKFLALLEGHLASMKQEVSLKEKSDISDGCKIIIIFVNENHSPTSNIQKYINIKIH